MIGRRGFITGLISLVAAPAIVRAGSLMPVKVMIEPYGVGPAMSALQLMKDLAEIHERIQRAFFMDLGAFGSAAIMIDQDGVRHVPVQEFLR